MTYDFKAKLWEIDINSFTRWKVLLEKILHNEGEFYNEHRARIRGYMLTIQERWPQYIKRDEIP